MILKSQDLTHACNDIPSGICIESANHEHGDFADAYDPLIGRLCKPLHEARHIGLRLPSTECAASALSSAFRILISGARGLP